MVTVAGMCEECHWTVQGCCGLSWCSSIEPTQDTARANGGQGHLGCGIWRSSPTEMTETLSEALRGWFHGCCTGQIGS